MIPSSSIGQLAEVGAMEPRTQATGPVGGSGADLARGAIGLREVLFQSITHMAPAAAVAFSIIVGAPFAGGALPLAVVLALVACTSRSAFWSRSATRLPRRSWRHCCT